MTSGKYTRVGASKGPLTIGGAEKKMTEDSSFTYVPQFGVAGPLSDVEAHLKEHHPSDASKALQSAYNLKNLKKATVRKAFTKEMEEWEEQREERTKRRQAERETNLLILVELLRRYQEQRRTDGTVAGKKSGHRTLRDKLAEVVSSGKVMDVTSAREKAKGVTRVLMKSNSIKRRLASDEADPLYNVVYNPRVESRSEGVRHFLVEYGGFSDEQIESIVTAVTDGADFTVRTTTTPVSTSRPSSPLTKRFTSPLRRNNDTTVDDLLDGLNA